MTAKTAPKITLWEFPAAGKNLHAARSVALVLRDHAGDRQLAKQSRCFDSAAVAGYAAAAGHLYLDEQGRLLCLQLPAGHVLYRHPLGLARENKGVAAFAGFVGYAVMNLAVNFWLTAKVFCPPPTRDPEGQQYPEHYRHSVNRYRDPRGGDRRNYRLAAA